MQRRVSVSVDADVSPFVRSLSGAAASTRAFARELESADSRMANLVQTGLALAPALVPLGASAVPAIAGLTTQLGFAVAAAGTAVLAFQGVGDALESLNDYQIEPTAENFTKLQEELNKLGPAGQEFALYLQTLRPQMQELQDIAQQGMLPGVEEGLRSLMRLMPEVSGIIERVSTTMGTLVMEAGQDLASDRWADFFAFLDREAAPTLTAMGETLGNVVKGLAEMVMAFNPLADDFSAGMVRMSESFAQWAENLSGTEGFRGFVDYVRQSGPAALDALGGIAEAFIALLQAAAPVGQVVLPMVEALAEGIAAIASSPAGPVIVSLAAAVGILGRSMALLQTVGLRGGESMLGRMFGGAVKPIKEATGALTTVVSASERATMSVKEHEKAERSRAQALKSGAARLGQGAALLGAFTVAQSDLAESAGVANTAMFGLMGTLLGPWGAAAGAGVGLAMDLASANNDVEEAMRAAGEAATSSAVDFTTQAATMDALRQKADEWNESVKRSFSWNPEDVGVTQSFQDFLNAVSDIFTNTGEESEELAHQMMTDFHAMRQGAADFYAELNNGDLSMLHATDEELTRFVTEIAPALQRAGYDIRDVLLNRQNWESAAAAVTDYNATMDSASGKSEAVGDALADLASQMETNVVQADALKDAMDALFGVELSQAEALDAWRSGLKDLRRQIRETNGELKGNSDAALENREQIRSSVEALQDRIAADAAAGKSGDKLVETLQAGRQAIIEQATAAGASKDEVADYLDTLGLTPKNLETVITTPGLMDAKDQVKALQKLYGLTPKEVRTIIAQAQMDDSQANIRRLAELYDLTPREVRTLVTADTSQAEGAIRGVTQSLLGLDGKVARTYVTTVYNEVLGRDALGGLQARSEGGTVNGQRDPYGDKVPTLLAPGEEVISNRYGQADKWRALLKAINSNRLADGGTVGMANGGTVAYSLDQQLELLRLQQQIVQLRADLAATGENALKPLARKIAEAELDATRRDLNQARRAPFAERRATLRDQRAALRGIEFDVEAGASVEETREALREFRRDVREAGGEWTTQMGRTAHRLIDLAKATERSENRLEREQEKRDRLADKLDEEIAALEQVKSAMASFSQSVAGNFLTDPFNMAPALGAAAGPVSNPALDAARAALASAEGNYQRILGSGGDRLQRSYEASKALAEVAEYRSQVDELERSTQATVEAQEATASGLEAFRETLVRDTEAAESFYASLTSLSGVLAPGLFEQLAASGDTALAGELAGLGPGGVAEINDLWAQREAAAAQVATMATQQVFGAQFEAATAAVQATEAAISRQDRTIERLNNRLENLGNRVQNGAERGIAKLEPQIGRIEAAIAGQTRQIKQLQQAGKRNGRN